jgi:hypothetical protein
MTVNSSQSFFLVCSFLLISSAINAQQVYVETGFSSAFFKDYVNNLGKNTLDLNYSKSQESFLESGLRFDLYEDRIKLDLGLSYSKYKINTGFYAGSVSVPMTYDLSYFNLKIGGVFNIVNEQVFKIQIHSHLSYDWLTSGTNSYRDLVIDLDKDNTFDKTLLRLHRGLSAECTISKEISIYISYNVADSFKENDKDSNMGEKYSLHTNTFSLGLLFDISKNMSRLWNRFRR